MAAIFMAACDSIVYEDEGDCSITYRVKFRYDMNMKFADALAHEVHSIALYVFDAEGKYVDCLTEQDSTLLTDGYLMPLPLPPGSYRLVAWCGVGNQESFSLPELQRGSSTVNDLYCRMKLKHDSLGAAYSDCDLKPLFHGMSIAELGSTEGVYTYPMTLTKNTNVVRVQLQQLSGEAIDVEGFTFTITDSNATMDYANNIVGNDPLIYYAWYTEMASTDVDNNVRGGVQTAVNMALAELTTGRLMADHNTRLNVFTPTGRCIISIPLIKYALLVKGNYHKAMSDQEYLDRQDEYNLTFFLDRNLSWINTNIYINSWEVVLQEEDIE